MGKRWGRGMLMGALAACSLPTITAAQQPVGDPVPLASMGSGSGAGSAFPSYQGGVMPASYMPPGGPMGPGMGGPPGMPGMPGMGGGGAGFLPTMPAPQSLTGVATPAPMGRKDYDFSHAFSFDGDGMHVYASFGWKALQRGQMQNQLLAVVDPNTTDVGIPITSNLPATLSFKDAPVDMAHGFQGSLGLFYDDMLLEIAGWALPSHSAGSKVLVNPGRLSSYFFNIPEGFEGTNAGLWSNADVMTLRLESTFYNIELNSHLQSGGDNWTYDLMLGARYMNINEKLSFFTSDDAVQIGNVPFTDALITHRAQNNLLGMQLGMASSYQMHPMFGVSWENRGGVYANLMDVNHVLQRGDGLFAYDTGVQKWDVAASYETGAFFHVNGPWLRVRAGYEFKWIFNVATAENQFDYDLTGAKTKLDTNGTIFYHGPTVTCDIIW